jgi:hypothetical protein
MDSGKCRLSEEIVSCILLGVFLDSEIEAVNYAETSVNFYQKSVLFTLRSFH